MRILIVFIISLPFFSFGAEKNTLDLFLFRRAENGDAEAQLELSQFYYDKADTWLRQSIKQGHIPALRVLYEQSGDVPSEGLEVAVERILAQESAKIKRVNGVRVKWIQNRKQRAEQIQVRILENITEETPEIFNNPVYSALPRRRSEEAPDAFRNRIYNAISQAVASDESVEIFNERDYLELGYDITVLNPDLVKKAEKGDAEAQWKLSQFYNNKADVLLEESAKRGHVPALRVMHERKGYLSSNDLSLAVEAALDKAELVSIPERRINWAAVQEEVLVGIMGKPRYLSRNTNKCVFAFE